MMVPASSISLPDLGKTLDVAIFSGFHYLKAGGQEFEKKLKKIGSQLGAVRKRNGNHYVHFSSNNGHGNVHCFRLRHHRNGIFSFR